jgi:DNA-binding HxlR family transcriptional regulator
MSTQNIAGREMREAAASSEIAALAPFCHQFASLMNMLSRRWMGVILRVLLGGPRRFSEIMAAVPGLSDPLLTQRLRELETKSLVIRRVTPSSPVRVEYELTDAGKDLQRAVRVLSEWAEKWLPAQDAEPALDTGKD